MQIPEGTYHTKVMTPMRSARTVKQVCKSCNGRGEFQVVGGTGLIERRRCPACAGRGYGYMTK